jgi:hypothetical protein
MNIKVNKIKITSICTALTTITVVFVTITQAIAEQKTGFKTPSGNIYCLVEENDNLRCELSQNTAKLPPKPKDCDLDWGNSFVMDLKGKASRLCHGDTIANSNYPVLAYGKTWRSQGFSCLSKASGLTCTNQAKKGWQISKTAQKLF